MDLDFFLEILGIPSTSGEERRLALFLKEKLKAPEVIEQEVGDGTLNLLFDWSGTGHPSFVFCTHLDTVPPYIAPSVELVRKGEILPDGRVSEIDDTIIKGRGSCDAKGQIFTMYNACQRLQEEGYKDFGLLLLAGEETGSFGAKAYSKDRPGGAFVLVGEPTDNCLATAAKGTKSFEVTIPGKACHSGYPEYGESAVEKFVEVMNTLKIARFPKDPVLGPTPETRFRIYFRTTFKTDSSIQEKLLKACPTGTVIQAFGGDTPQEYFHSVKGIESKPVSFGSDAPRLDRFVRRAICGPGSILVAHTPKEYVSVSEMEKAVRQDVMIFKTVMGLK